MTSIINRIQIITKKLSTLVKPLGYMENISHFITQKEIYDIECAVYNNLKYKIYDHWEEIFKRNNQIYHLDKQILNSAKKLSIFWRLRFFQIRLLRLVYFILDCVFIIIKSPPKFYFSYRKSGNLKSKRTIIVFTNNKSRSSIFNISNQYLQYDIIVSKLKPKGCQNIVESNFSFRSRLQCLKLKIRFFYIPSNQIFHTMAARDLFSVGFGNFSNISNNSGVFSREGTTSLAKMFLYVAGQYGFLRNVIYNLPALTPNILFPVECENLVLISDVLPFYVHKHTNVIVLNDNPYLDWREIAKVETHKKCIGLLLGDDFNRWAEQKVTDRVILDQLKLQGCQLCLGRPHPQELTRPHRVEYYNDLLKSYPFLQLEIGPQADFLKNIKILIAYSKSTMVQESLLCNKPVIEYRAEYNHSPNEKVLSISNGLGKTLSNIDKLQKEIDTILSWGNDLQRKKWYGFLNNLNIDSDINSNVIKIFENKLIRFNSD